MWRASPAGSPGVMRRIPEREPEGFVVRALAGLGGVLVLAVAFGLILALVAVEWAPLRSFDRTVTAGVNGWVSGRPLVVSTLHVLTDLGGSQAAWLLLPLATIWLLVRRAPATATYVAVTGVGLGVLNWGTKALVDRVRPVVDAPVADAPGLSFPSGHAMGSTVTYGVLLLVFLPAVPPRWRRAVIRAVVALVLVVGLTRIGLGVHYPSDVVAGWVFGVLWLAVSTASFRRWRRSEGLHQRPLEEGVAQEGEAAVEPAPAHDRALPHGAHTAAELLVAAVLIWGALVGLGLLITDVLTGIRDTEITVMEWFVSTRTPRLTDIAYAVGQLGGTLGIVVALIVGASLALALTRRWAPALFLLLGTTGETAMFLGAAAIVSRTRPPVEKLSPQLPPTSSFPSGHAAATLATYGAIALLVLAWSRHWWRYVAAVLAVLVVVAVAWSRLYRGVHYPSDVLSSLLYTSAWLTACWYLLKPARGSPRHQQ